MTTTMHPAQRAAELLQARGIPCYFEPFDGSISLEDDGAVWTFGTVNETWDATLYSDPSVGTDIGTAVTDIPSDSTDPEAIADAIEAAFRHGVGLEIWRPEAR